MRVLTVRQPWADLIVSGQKNVENRTWRPPASIIGQRIAIHAGLRIDVEAYLALGALGDMPVCDLADEPVLGAIIGTVRVDGVVTTSESPWFSGPIGWLFSDAVRIPPIEHKGALGLRELPEHVARMVARDEWQERHCTMVES